MVNQTGEALTIERIFSLLEVDKSCGPNKLTAILLKCLELQSKENKHSSEFSRGLSDSWKSHIEPLLSSAECDKETIADLLQALISISKTVDHFGNEIRVAVDLAKG